MQQMRMKNRQIGREKILMLPNDLTLEVYHYAT